MSANPEEDYRYTETHEWVSPPDAQGVSTVGITDHAQLELGDVVFVELPEPGSALTQGEPFGVVESVKAASDLYAPLSGEAVEINVRLNGSPDLVNKEPYKGGWMLKMRLSDPTELGNLMDAPSYAEHLKTLH